ncbi:MAG TPA: FAD-binding oxidoreductase, partial [Chloroflexota bacterium]|nr:FAD-binding oxidoreductase [Chloroflexota bacterium]
TTVAWPGAAKTSVGPDLRALFIGEEGMLGVIAEVVVQLFPWPERREFLAYRFPSFAEGFKAIVAMDAIGLRPAMIDYEEEEGEPLEVPADMYLAFDGPDEIVRAATRRAKQICQSFYGIARERGAAARFWDTRHASAEGFIRRLESRENEEPEAEEPGMEWRYVDVAVPTDRVLDYCRQVAQIADRNGVAVHSFGVWARPELVSYVLEGQNQPSGDAARGPLDLAMDEVLTLARAEGGSIEYCHGVGVRLAHLLPIELGTALDLLRRIKHALDPADVLNPGKLGVE